MSGTSPLTSTTSPGDRHDAWSAVGVGPTIGKSGWEKLRILLSRLFVAAVFALALASPSAWSGNLLASQLLFAGGLSLATIGCLGRVWCLAHIAGRKDRELVTAGPYSLCRNPLYLFSLVGAAGVAMATGTLTVPAIVVVAFLVTYPSIIRHEERRLATLYGQDYQDYLRSTPALFPNFRNYRPAGATTIDHHKFGHGVVDAAWFVLAAVGAHVIAMLHAAGHFLWLSTAVY